MYEEDKDCSRALISRNGLVFASLPPTTIRRWIPQRKAEIVTAVRTGLLSMDEACVRYQLSREEFESWNRAYATEGLAGLRASARHKPEQARH